MKETEADPRLRARVALCLAVGALFGAIGVLSAITERGALDARLKLLLWITIGGGVLFVGLFWLGIHLPLVKIQVSLSR